MTTIRITKPGIISGYKAQLGENRTEYSEDSPEYKEITEFLILFNFKDAEIVLSFEDLLRLGKLIQIT